MVKIVDRQVSDAVERAAVRDGYTPFQARIIAGRLSDREAHRVSALVRPQIVHLSSPDALPDIEPAAQAVANAIVRGLPILIISDFDCDGASGHSVVRLALRDYFGVPESLIHGFIGHRLRDGYGVSDTLTDRILQQAPTPSLVITVDQGSTDQLRIARLRKKGIGTVVTDHHGVPDEGHPADAIACVNPARKDSEFEDPYVAGVHVAWLLCCAVRQRLIELGYLPKSAPKLGGLLDLVALGTMVDCVDLARSANNRIVLSRGLELMNQPGARLVWRALGAALNSEGAITASTLGFRFGPVINARGRLDCALGSVDLLLCNDECRANEMAEQLVAFNAERKAVQNQMMARALPWADRQVKDGAAAISIVDPDGHPGVHGICAAKLVEETGRPVAYFSPKYGTDLLTASLRTVSGFHVRNALKEIAQLLLEDVVAWGGHSGAGGVTIKRNAYERFAELWNAVASRILPVSSRGARVLTDGRMPVRPSLDVLREIGALEPFGRQWESPVFRSNARIEELRAVGDGTHLKVGMTIDGQSFEGIWFSAVRRGICPIAQEQDVEIAYELDSNTFRGETRLQLLIRHASPTI